MKDEQIDGGEMPVQSYAIGHLMAIPYAIGMCECGNELGPIHPYDSMIHAVEDAQFDTQFDDRIGFISLVGNWRENAEDAHSADLLILYKEQ